ncbi:MAG: N-acetylmuramoyl-L-alanine amidase-like domain-containing protein [Myxococcota bacterium]
MISFVALALAAAPAWSSMGDAQRADAMLELQKLPTLRERLLAATEGFLGTPYVLSPLGEGAGRDPDPLVRWDAVDCVTLVEQSLALSTAAPGSLVETLTALRYDGPPSWENRLHVMESQWLPEFVARGYLTDVTARYGGKKTRRVKKTITAATWQEKSGASLALPPERRTIGTWEFDIVPSDVAAKALQGAPAGLVVVVVRADRPWLVTRVSHVAVLVQGPKGPMLRHASRSFKRVVDEPLARYLTRNLDFGQWTIEGLALFEPTLPPK